MIPRGTPDIGWRDLAAATGWCWSAIARDRDSLSAEIAAFWSSAADSLVCLSVRSGLDLLLQILALPPGSEVLVSAITIRDMTRILEHHGLVPVAIDMDMNTLSVAVASLEAACSDRTRAILIAHLFGSRMQLDEVVKFAHAHDLVFLEDAAQAFAADGYTGHTKSDVSFFSFGPIKTASALGGAVLKFKDADLCERLRSRQSAYPIQSRWRFLNRIVTFALFKILALPPVLHLFVVICRGFNQSHDAVIRDRMRSFAKADLFVSIRQQPCLPLLRLLRRRLQSANQARIQNRIRVATGVLSQLPATTGIGRHAHHHTHWVLPMQTPFPDALAAYLWQHGFDGSKGSSSLYVMGGAPEAQQVMARCLYLPMDPNLSDRDIQRLGSLINEFHAACHAAIPSSCP